MATIRIPASAEPLLPFCRTSGTLGPHIWETYADMIVFLAAYAYGSDETQPVKSAVLKTTNPIDLGIFRSRGLYPILLAIGLADQRNWLIAKQSDELATIVERYASVGANLLCAGNVILTADALAHELLSRLSSKSVAPPTI